MCVLCICVSTYWIRRRKYYESPQTLYRICTRVTRYRMCNNSAYCRRTRLKKSCETRAAAAAAEKNKKTPLRRPRRLFLFDGRRGPVCFVTTARGDTPGTTAPFRPNRWRPPMAERRRRRSLLLLLPNPRPFRTGLPVRAHRRVGGLSDSDRLRRRV